METAEYTNINTNEGNHFYYVAVHELVLKLVEGVLNGSRTAQILDAGCGTGALAKKLERFGTVKAVDMHDEAIKFARKRGVDVMQASVENLPFAADTFDLVTSIDVIYHKAVGSDCDALKQFNRVLKPGGHLVIRVPAEPALYSSHDDFVHTARRYTKGQFDALLRQAGFDVKRLTYCQSPLFLPALVKAQFDKQTSQTHSSVIEHQSQWLNETIKMVLQLENKFIITGGAVPKGIGLIAVCRKAQAPRE